MAMNFGSTKGSRAPFTIVQPTDFRPFKTFGIGGVAGSGKTVLAGLAGKGKKILNLDLEGGSSSYVGKFFKDHPDASDVEIVPMYDTSHNDPTKMTSGIIGALEYLAGTKNKEGYDVVVIDSLTEFQERFIIHNASDGFTKYRQLGDAFHRMMQTAQGVPAHVVFTSRLVLRNDEVLGHEVVRFSLADKSWSVVSGMLDVIAYKTVQHKGFGNAAREVHVLDARQSSRFSGKDRFGIGEMTDPTMKKVIEVVTGGNA